jgi:hypothetical protein
LSADERRHLAVHLQAVAERADRRSPSGLLLTRQAYYLLGFAPGAEVSAWLSEQYRRDRRLLHPGRGWTQAWPLIRSTACALTRLGDPEPMRAFIADHLTGDDRAETANLSYFAAWTGEVTSEHATDEFMVTTPLQAWRGDRLLRHLLDRLAGPLGLVELNVHTLWTLVQVRPDLLAGSGAADELNAHIGRLLDENLISDGTRRELEALRYGAAIAARR